MALTSWLLRCIPGLSTILLLILFEYTLGLFYSIYLFLTRHPIHQEPALLGFQLVFCAYSLFLHTLALFFPFRLSLAARKATQAIWLNNGKELQAKTCSEVTQVVILPAYKESVETLQDTLSVLASHQDARASYDVFLAMEERDPNAVFVAQKIISHFEKSFSNISYTCHPAGIEGESAGKSSNVSWAAREVERKYNGQKNVLVTVMDSDAHLLNAYFQHVRERHHHTRQESSYVLYVPPIVFDRNAHHVPRLVRVADLMWCGAGLSCYGNNPPQKHVAIPTAVYTLSLPLVQLANGWDAGANAIGEDMHMMLKCYFATKGLIRIESIPSPVSLCNISTSLKGVRGWFDNHSARYSQGLRHMWGCLDAGYAVGKWLNMNCAITPSSSPDTSPGPRRRKLSDCDIDIPCRIIEPKKWTWRTLIVFVRLAEAHFLPIHLFLILIASAIYTSLPISESHSIYMTWTLLLTSWMRAAGFAGMIMYFVTVYEEFHRACITVREVEMKKVGLYHEESFSYRRRWSLNTVFDYIVFPIAGTLYGSVPLLQAEFSHFWTENLVYLVSAKPVRAVVDSMGISEKVDGKLEEGVLAGGQPRITMREEV